MSREEIIEYLRMRSEQKNSSCGKIEDEIMAEIDRNEDNMMLCNMYGMGFEG